jgi:hypothetical protein
MSEARPAAGEAEPHPGAGIAAPRSAAPEQAESGKTESAKTEYKDGAGGEGASGGKAGSVVAQVVGSTSVVGALLIYMGWNYYNAKLQPFFIPSPQSVGLGTVDFALSGILPLFRSNAVFFAAVLVAVILGAVRAVGAAPDNERGEPAAIRTAPGTLFWAGLVLTVGTLSVTWPSVSGGDFGGWFASDVDGVYLVLALLAAGQLLMAWPARRSASGQVAYPLALVVVAALALWAGGVYAGTLGYQAALNIQNHVPQQTAVTVYSAQSLDLSGPGVRCASVRMSSGYPYECTGLRLLWSESGTYYLLPEGWTMDERMYILNDSDQIRIELSPGCTPKSPALLC